MTAHIPRKRFGQHFLVDSTVINRIVSSLNRLDDDTWVEIGPGKGALTNSLTFNYKHLYLIELDRDLAGVLQKKYNHDPKVSVINEDILNFNFQRIANENCKIKLLGNLPYNISTPLFFHLANFSECINEMTFMIQKEVAQRLTAKINSKAYGRLTLSMGLRFSTITLFDVPASAFSPPPKVESSVIKITPKQQMPSKEIVSRYDEILKIAFSKRRKTLKNSLANVISEKTMKKLQIDPKLRAQSLTQKDFIRLAQYTEI